MMVLRHLFWIAFLVEPSFVASGRRQCSRFLYASLRDRMLTKVDMNTGAQDAIGKLFDGHQTEVQSLHHDDIYQRMYALVKMNTTTVHATVNHIKGKLRKIGMTSVGDLFGLTMTENGVLYTHRRGNRMLYKLNRASGAATPVFQTDFKGIIDMAYRVEDGLIYATDGTRLFALNPTTLQTDALGRIRNLPTNGRLLSISWLNDSLFRGVTAAGRILEIDSATMSAKTVAKASLGGKAAAGTLKCKGPTMERERLTSNVLMITIDDLNAWTGSLGGHPMANTPNIDRLARRSQNFIHAYAPSSVCTPSRTAVFTGIRPSTSGVYSNSGDWYSIMRNSTNLIRFFKENGYATYGSGKLFPGGTNSNSFADLYGPNTWTQFNNNDLRAPPTTTCLHGVAELCTKGGGFDFGPYPVNDETRTKDYLRTSWIIDKLQKDHSKPFFMALGISKPHLDWKVPQKYFDMFPLQDIVLPVTLQNDLDDIPPIGQELVQKSTHELIVQHNLYERAVQAYLSSTTFADEMIGRVIDALENSKYKDNTTIVLWSDNGFHLGEKQHWKKATLWEEATRVPFIIHVPGLGQDGTVCASPVDLMSIFPTMVELAGVGPPPEHVEGDSVLRLLTDPHRMCNSEQWKNPAITSVKAHHALRQASWRYIRYFDGSEELYKHGNKDKYEWDNLAGLPEFASVIARLQTLLPTEPAPL